MRDPVGFLRNLPLPPGQVTGIVAVLVLERLVPSHARGPSTPLRALGAGILAGGVAVNVWATAERRRHADGEYDMEHPQSLVTTGPYALSRHPMYVGWWLIHLGVGLLRGSAWVAATVPAATLVEHLGVLAEERGLAREFGAEFARYRERVPRYAGWPRRGSTGRDRANRLRSWTWSSWRSMMRTSTPSCP